MGEKIEKSNIAKRSGQESTGQLPQVPTEISLLFLYKEQPRLFLTHCSFLDKISCYWALWEIRADKDAQKSRD